VDTKPFVFKQYLLNGLMSSDAGVVEALNVSTLTICADCRSDLLKGKLPHYALKNGLYRGILPEDFCDLTCVEEMVCAMYRNTAHVTGFMVQQTQSNHLSSMVIPVHMI